jgi:transposase
LDKENIIEAMKRLKENITFPDDVYYIDDSALYSEGNIGSIGINIKWITRVPSTLNLAEDWPLLLYSKREMIHAIHFMKSF